MSIAYPLVRRGNANAREFSTVITTTENQQAVPHSMRPAGKVVSIISECSKRLVTIELVSAVSTLREEPPVLKFEENLRWKNDDEWENEI